MSPRSKTETRTFATVIRFLAGFFRRSRIELRHRHEMNNDQSHKLRLRACLETTRGAVFGEKAGWRGATKENIPGGSSTEEQRSQTAFSAKTLQAAGLLSVAGVGSFLTARCGDAWNSPPWPQPKSLAAAPLVVSKQALRIRALRSLRSLHLKCSVSHCGRAQRPQSEDPKPFHTISCCCPAAR